MANAQYKKHYDAADGNRPAYFTAVREAGLSATVALLMWHQFERFNQQRSCVCRTGEELLNFLKHLPTEHLSFALSTTYSDDIESGYVNVEVNPPTKTIQIVGSTQDV